MGRKAILLTAVLALVWAGLGVAAPAADPRTCLVVDTDVGVDDYRALAVVAPARDVRAVVVTEGISGVPNGATAVSMFLAGRGAGVPVLPGLASPNPPAYDWLPPVRAAAERMNNFLGAAVPANGTPSRLAAGVRSAVHGCDRVDLLVLGPWTSYPKYASALGGHVRVLASGRSFAENNPDNFNCEYDLAACQAAPRRAVYVDLPASPPYDPTPDMVSRLETAGLPGLLKAVLEADPSQWLGTRLWDDAAALSLVRPRVFAPQGKHLEPAVDEDTFRDLVVDAINRG
ncbi:hypothetical protein [Actinophytocola algeriensis]|uniref:Inosine-uridine preferring nucleoside hydrolase n=1 Tax=Actinophytocola algeriensis TaxID=1768010 RepID=A0A7W7VGM6_9PSEU|nr:hypothetical protein [Actinophytocola algeriensis]MBB4909508.1 hypothetical protein [Actinophytocola algeriensis]MBE1475498.1 hypothetical protein [Actinophytocola algeriensis]